MRIEKLPPIRTTLRDSDHPYLTGAWTPLHEEVTAHDLPVLEGAVPADLDGVYLRNTENQIHQPLGRYHPFDGDAMIHQLDFRRGQVSYRNRFVRTRCLAAEQEAGGSLWGGLMDPPGTSLRPGFGAHGSLKDSSSTDITAARRRRAVHVLSVWRSVPSRPRDTRHARRCGLGAARRRVGASQGGSGHRRADVLQLLEARALHALRRRRS